MNSIAEDNTATCSRTKYKGWMECRLIQCCQKIGSGITPKGGDSVYVDTGIPLIRSQNVLNGEFSMDGLRHITPEQHERMKGSKVLPGDILFNITGASIGRCCLMPSSFQEANVNQHVCIVRLKESYHPAFFAYSLNSKVAKRALHESQAGGGREGLNFKNLGDFKVPVPPLPEQKAIAAVLQCWDRGIQKLEAKLAAKERVKKGLMQQLLSGRRRMPGFGKGWRMADGEWQMPDGWNLFKLQDIAVIHYGKDWKTVSDPNGAYPVYGTGGLMGYAKKALYEKPSILLGRKGTINKPIFINRPFWAVDTTFAIQTNDNADTRFLYYKFLTINWLIYSEASGLPSLSRSTIYQVPLDLPPLEEQKAIVEVLSAADR